jgi:hypothetical protein
MPRKLHGSPLQTSFCSTASNTVTSAVIVVVGTQLAAPAATTSAME